MTTKLDILRDLIKDAMLNLEFEADLTDDGDGASPIPEWKIDELVGDMLANFDEAYDEQEATDEDMTMRVEFDRKGNKEAEELFPGITESLNKLTIRKEL